MIKDGGWRLILLICLFILGIDFISKSWTNAHLPRMGLAYPNYPYGGIPVFSNLFGIEFSISHLTNRGAAWGVLGEYQELLLIARIFLIGGMLLYLFYFNNMPSWRLPLALVITGAIGNIIDYFVYGHVVDMLHFILWGYDFPVFNVADCAVSVGIFWLICISSFRQMNHRCDHEEGT